MGPSPDRVPLVVGVTGHRDLRSQDIPRLEQEVDAIITRLRRDYLEGDNETPLILLSALAEGADQIAARVALAQGVRLIAPLPMPLDEYRRDFEPGLAPGAAGDFEKNLSQAAAAPVVPFTKDNSLEAVRVNADKRAEQYRAVGLFIIQHCDVLIALWDGNENDLAAGGTAEIVAFKRHGIPLSISGSAHASLDGSEIGPVIHVVTPRRKTGSAASDVSVRAWGLDLARHRRGDGIRRLIGHAAEFSAHLVAKERRSAESSLSPANRHNAEVWETFRLLVALTREFNNEAAALAVSANGPPRTAQNIDYLFTDPDTGHLDGDAKQRGLTLAPHWCKLYGIADTLAQNRQRQFKHDWQGLFVLGFFAFVLFALLIHFESADTILLTAYTAFVAVIYVIFFRARVMRHQEQFLDYRALAEALRVAVYWSILGIDEQGPAASDGSDANTMGMLANSYPIKQPSELAWVKMCLRTPERAREASRTDAKSGIDPAAHAVVRRYWVAGQLSYFGLQGARHTRRAEALEGWALILLFVTPFILVPLLVVTAFGTSQSLDPVWHKFFLVIVGILPGLAAALTGYSERLAMKAQARQYDRMRTLFGRAYDLLPETVDGDLAPLVRSLYYELGTEAMKENAEWVAIYRQRPIQPVQ
ncbi:MAG TPA: hypothetical protein VFC45_07325 [Pseudolabrys sp.]|nr:hypothetical protein [Pseudolabrys sp.]